MKKEIYDKYVLDWNNWYEEFNTYLNKRKNIIKTILDPDKQYIELVKLKEETGFGDFSSKSFGIFTEIRDLDDLMDPNFILPGETKSFLDYPWSNEVINGFGKYVRSDLENKEGVVIGYGYDFTDGYLIIKKDDGTESTLNINQKLIWL